MSRTYSPALCRTVSCRRPGRPRYADRFVRVDRRSFGGVIGHKAMQCLPARVGNDLCLDLPRGTVPQPGDRNLANGTAPGVQLLAGVLVRLLASRVELICLCRPGKYRTAAVERFADAVRQDAMPTSA